MHDQVQNLVMFYQFLPCNCIIQVQESRYPLCPTLLYSSAHTDSMSCKKSADLPVQLRVLKLVSVPYWVPVMYQPSVH